MNLLTATLKQILNEAIIEKKWKISDLAYAIRLKSKSIQDIDFIAGYFIRICIGLSEDSLSGRDFVRSYSIWNIDKSSGTMDIAIATKSQGAGANWVLNQKVGNKVYFKLKKGNFILDCEYDNYLMIGDLSALSHLYIIKRNLSEDKQIESLIYSQNVNELYNDIDNSKPFNFHELPVNPTDQLICKIKEIVPKMTGKKMVYIAGDSRVCSTLNKYFKNELNWETKLIKIKPFWNPEKKGLE